MRQFLWATACLLLAACTAAPPKEAVFACSGTLCPVRFECRDGYCFPLGGDGGCVPKDCEGDLSCGEVPDGCGRMIQCGDCVSPKTCGGSGVANHCGCTPESDPQLCAVAEFTCGPLTKKDSCGVERTVECGTCGAGTACVATPKKSDCLGCVPEGDAAFCARHSATCGMLTAKDNCGVTRVRSCGSCAGCASDGGACCLARAQSCNADPECCDGRSCFNGRCERLDGGF